MDHVTLIAQHDAIDAACQMLLTLTRGAMPQPVEASRTLALLSRLVRDHLAAEEPVIYETAAVTQGTRHGALTTATVAELDALKHDWAAYLYRWHERAVADDWTGFAADSEAMLGRLRDRVARETAILYSLAQHYSVIEQGN